MIRQLYGLRMILLSAVIAVLFGACVHEDSELFSIAVGDILPDFSVTDDAGDVISAASLHGAVCLIAFVNTSCNDCRRELSELQKVYETFMNRSDGIRFIMIGRTESQLSMAAYWEEQNLTLPYSAQANDVVYRKFAEQGIPRIFIADGSGIIRFSSEDRFYIPAENLADQLQLVITGNGKN